MRTPPQASSSGRKPRQDVPPAPRPTSTNAQPVHRRVERGKCILRGRRGLAVRRETVPPRTDRARRASERHVQLARAEALVQSVLDDEHPDRPRLAGTQRAGPSRRPDRSARHRGGKSIFKVSARGATDRNLGSSRTIKPKAFCGRNRYWRRTARPAPGSGRSGAKHDASAGLTRTAVQAAPRARGNGRRDP